MAGDEGEGPGKKRLKNAIKLLRGLVKAPGFAKYRSMRRSTVLLWSAVLSVGGLFLSSGFAADESVETTAKNPAVAALEGVILTRPEGNLIQVLVEENRIVLRFFNDLGEPEPVDVDSGTIRIMPGGRNPESLPIVPSSDRMLMTHGKKINPPFNFNINIHLFRKGSDESVERYLIHYP